MLSAYVILHVVLGITQHIGLFLAIKTDWTTIKDGLLPTRRITQTGLGGHSGWKAPQTIGAALDELAATGLLTIQRTGPGPLLLTWNLTALEREAERLGYAKSSRVNYAEDDLKTSSAPRRTPTPEAAHRTVDEPLGELEHDAPASHERVAASAIDVVWCEAYCRVLGLSEVRTAPRDWESIARYTRAVSSRTGVDASTVAAATLYAWIGVPGRVGLANDREAREGYPLSWIVTALDRCEPVVLRRLLGRKEQPAHQELVADVGRPLRARTPVDPATHPAAGIIAGLRKAAAA